MCIISLFPQNVAINVEGVNQGGIRNKDGHGWAIASKNGLFIGKSMNRKEALDSFVEVREREGLDSIALFHSRWATHGTVNEYNVHPFYVGEENGETVMAHNGIMPSQFQPDRGDARSDTRIFAEAVAGFIENARGIPSRRGGIALGKIIGSGNKFVFLSVKDGPRVRIVNAHLGVQDGGAWYSNSGYIVPKYKSYSGSSYYGGWSNPHRDREWVNGYWADVEGGGRVWVNGYFKDKEVAPSCGSDFRSAYEEFWGSLDNVYDDSDSWWRRQEEDYQNRLAAEKNADKWDEKEVADAIAAEFDGKCPGCGKSDKVDWLALVCNGCDYCIDHLQGMDECGCFAPREKVDPDLVDADAVWEVVDSVESDGGTWDDLPMGVRDWLRKHYPNLADYYESETMLGGVGYDPDEDEKRLAQEKAIALPPPAYDSETMISDIVDRMSEEKKDEWVAALPPESSNIVKEILRRREVERTVDA